MTFKKGQKPPKKGEKLNQETLEKVENAVETVVENETSNDIDTELKNVQAEQKNDVIGTVGGTAVHVEKPIRGIKFESFQAVVPMYMIKDDELRQYLVNNGFGTNVWQKDKEWLEKHGADMKMIERLKNYLNGER